WPRCSLPSDGPSRVVPGRSSVHRPALAVVPVAPAGGRPPAVPARWTVGRTVRRVRPGLPARWVRPGLCGGGRSGPTGPAVAFRPFVPDCERPGPRADRLLPDGVLPTFVPSRQIMPDG